MPRWKDGGLSRKQKDWADVIIKNPKISGTKAATQTYNVTSMSAAQNISSRNLNNPNIQLYLQEHGKKAITDMIEIASYSKELGRDGSKEGASYAAVAISANKDIADRAYGKATQRIEQTTEGVQIIIDLTNSLKKEEQQIDPIN